MGGTTSAKRWRARLLPMPDIEIRDFLHFCSLDGREGMKEQLWRFMLDFVRGLWRTLSLFLDFVSQLFSGSGLMLWIAYRHQCHYTLGFMLLA